MTVLTGTGDLLRRRPPRRPSRVADITVDGHRLGTLQSVDDITPAMRAHGITAGDLKPVLSGRRQVRHFLCGGDVRIVGRST